MSLRSASFAKSILLLVACAAALFLVLRVAHRPATMNPCDAGACMTPAHTEVEVKLESEALAGNDPIGHFCYISGSQSSCAAGLWCCANHCAWMLYDDNNCGGCGITCTGGTTCQNGGCCSSGLTYCTIDGTGCFDLENGDPNHCGACNRLCVGFPHGTPTCSGGGCVVGSCNTGYADCNGVYTDGCEVNLNTDSNNCGACGTVCTGGKTCQSGTCACPTGQTDCSGTCKNEQTDVNNCGSCGHVCTGTTPACCSGVCKDLATDVVNCGSCGYSCSASGAGPNMQGNNCCQGGKCGDLCHDGTTCTANGGFCSNTSSNCYNSGNGCTAGHDCCPYQPDNGSDQCVATSFQTPDYCGSCAGHCKAGHSCILQGGSYVCGN